MTRHATDVAGYTYKADTYCPSCILAKVCEGIKPLVKSWERIVNTPPEQVETALDGLALLGGIDRYSEVTFDSDEFPKVVFVSQLEDDRCGACGAVL